MKVGRSNNKKWLYYGFFITLIMVAGCEIETLGEFDESTEELLKVKHEPAASPVVKVSEDCDQVTLSWNPVFRAASYEVLLEGEVLASNLTDTFFVDANAPDSDGNYEIRSVNPYGKSESMQVMASKAIVPPTPEVVGATDRTKRFSVLTWDDVFKAQFYNVSVDGQVVAENITGNQLELQGLPEGEHKIGLQAGSVCGLSEWAYDTGENALMLHDGVLEKYVASSISATFHEGWKVAYKANKAEMSTIVFKTPNLVYFSLGQGYDQWKNQQYTQMRCFISEDGETFIETEFTRGPGVKLESEWHERFHWETTGDIPQGINYVKIEWDPIDVGSFDLWHEWLQDFKYWHY